MDKLVTIIIPCHKINPFLEDCIISAKRQQSASVLVIIDSDSVKLLEKVQSLRPDRIIKADVKSPAKARELGISQANTKLVAFLDSDDMIIEQQLDKQVSWMQKNNIEWSYTSYSLRKDEKIIGLKKANTVVSFNDLLKRCNIGNSTVVISKDHLPNILPSTPLEDFKLWLQLCHNLKCHPFDINSRIYNIHAAQTSQNKFKMLIYRYGVLRCHIGRFRATYYITRYHILENVLIRLGYNIP